MENLIGSKIKVLRKTKGLTQQDLADKMGVKRSTISNWEIGRRSPHISELTKLTTILGVGLDFFGVGDNDVLDLIARAKSIFENEDISSKEKIKIYKEIMKLYLRMGE